MMQGRISTSGVVGEWLVSECFFTHENEYKVLQADVQDVMFVCLSIYLFIPPILQRRKHVGLFNFNIFSFHFIVYLFIYLFLFILPIWPLYWNTGIWKHTFENCHSIKPSYATWRPKVDWMSPLKLTLHLVRHTILKWTVSQSKHVTIILPN